jgi:hypothetical protein
MATVLLRCRDAEMLGPVCDYISEDKTFSEAVREMRTNAQIHNEPEITTDDLEGLQEWLFNDENCCMDDCCS